MQQKPMMPHKARASTLLRIAELRCLSPRDVLRLHVTGFAARAAIVLAVFTEAHVMKALAKPAILVARAYAFRPVANGTEVFLGHSGRLARFCASGNGPIVVAPAARCRCCGEQDLATKITAEAKADPNLHECLLHPLFRYPCTLYIAGGVHVVPAQFIIRLRQRFPPDDKRVPPD